MARIDLNPPATPLNRLVRRVTRRRYGTELDPVRAASHSPRVLLAYLGFEQAVAQFKDLDERLRDLAVMASAHVIGCRWCTDFGYWQSHTHGVEEATLRAIPAWRESDLFSPVERQVLEYAEAMTRTPDEVTDEMVSNLDRAIGTAAVVDLTMMVAVENQRSRFNSAMGLVGQGFKDHCEVGSVSG